MALHSRKRFMSLETALLIHEAYIVPDKKQIIPYLKMVITLDLSNIDKGCKKTSC